MGKKKRKVSRKEEGQRETTKQGEKEEVIFAFTKEGEIKRKEEAIT